MGDPKIKLQMHQHDVKVFVYNEDTASALFWIAYNQWSIKWLNMQVVWLIMVKKKLNLPQYSLSCIYQYSFLSMKNM